MQDKVGGVMPAGLFLFIARRAELLLMGSNARWARQQLTFLWGGF
ncbi:hypothetical protein [Bradyrhizobium sp. AUGA SZCCT0169]|nr:hypothetical protein [Bradyrhizobium sp. AUGA SZCCT0169]